MIIANWSEILWNMRNAGLRKRSAALLAVNEKFAMFDEGCPMAFYVTLLEGPSPEEARAVLASDDTRVVRAVLRALRARLPEIALSVDSATKDNASKRRRHGDYD